MMMVVVRSIVSGLDMIIKRCNYRQHPICWQQNFNDDVEMMVVVVVVVVVVMVVAVVAVVMIMIVIIP